MMRRLHIGFAAALLLSAVGLMTASENASAAPDFQLPFPCGEIWSGETRTDHSPAKAVDFNRSGDEGDPVVASAAGTVITVQDLGDDSYGRYVVVDHGGGWTTYYAHLESFSVSVGDSVSSGEQVGSVGTTGGSTGPHLHFEQRYDGDDEYVVFNGSTAYYWGETDYTSNNACGDDAPATGTVNTESGVSLTIRSGPGTDDSAIGSLADGETYGITCQTYGETVTGTYGTSDIWNQVDGTSGYVSDAYTYTGSDDLVAPECSG